MNTEINKIRKTAKEKGLDVEIYQDRKAPSISYLHTDTSKFAGDVESLKNYKDEDIDSWGIVSAEDYNSTLCANCDSIAEKDTIIVLLNRDVAIKN